MTKSLLGLIWFAALLFSAYMVSVHFATAAANSTPLPEGKSQWQTIQTAE
jgi:hypothetical protein